MNSNSHIYVNCLFGVLVCFLFHLITVYEGNIIFSYLGSSKQNLRDLLLRRKKKFVSSDFR